MLMGLNQDLNVVSLNPYHKVQITTLSWVSVLPCSKQGGRCSKAKLALSGRPESRNHEISRAGGDPQGSSGPVYVISGSIWCSLLPAV